jgi:Dyp-type peroxidase family
MPPNEPPSAEVLASLPLDDLQGNVARGYSFPVAHFSFWRFLAEPARARTWLGTVLEVVTPGTPWAGDKPRSTFNIALSHSGLAALGLARASLESFPAEFRAGMAAQAADLGDVGSSDPEHWDFGNANRPLDVLLAIYGQTSSDVDARLALLRAANEHVLAEVYALPTAALAPDPRREHFGFRDGYGQPSIVGAGVASVPGQGTPLDRGKWKDLNPGEFILGHEEESGGVPRALPQPPALAMNGTFLVFRKLYQDVARFRKVLAEQAAAVLGANSEENREWIASRWIGRWRSGAPIALCPEHDDQALGEDWNRTLDFDYKDDPLGHRCPVGSHIRRVNPRAALPPHQLVRTHRILRRGLPYGPPLPEGSLDDDGVDRGVAFIALNASIQAQFRFVQKLWINDGGFASSGGLMSSDQDPVAGPQDRAGRFQCFDPGGQPRSMFDLPRLVSMRGGGYFFIPSLTGLRFLARGGSD